MINYFCISCKKQFQHDKKKNLECPYCHAREYVRPAQKFNKQTGIIKLNTKYIKARKDLTKKCLILEKAKYYLRLEHALVAALKKYCPNKEAFVECLELATKETKKKYKNQYDRLVKEGLICPRENMQK